MPPGRSCSPPDDDLSGALGPASPGALRDLPRDVGGGAAADAPYARCRPSIPSWISPRAARRIRKIAGQLCISASTVDYLLSEGIPKARRHLANPAGQRTARPPGLRISRIRSASRSVRADCGSRGSGTTSPTPVVMSGCLGGTLRRARRATGMTTESVDSTAAPRSALCRWKQAHHPGYRWPT